MSILFVHPAIRTYREILFRRLGEQDVHFLFSQINPPETHYGKETARILKTFRYPYWQAREVKGLPFGNLSPDLWRILRYKTVIFSFLTSIPFVFFALPLKLMGRRVLLFDESWMYPYEMRRYRVMLPWVKFLVRRCTDAFIVHSSLAKKMFVEEFHIPAEKIFIAYHTNVDFSTLPRDPAKAAEIESKVHAVCKNRKVILFLARIVEVKALDVLIRALKHVPQDACLIVVGTGPAQPACEQLACDLGLQDRVYFLGSCQSDESLYYHLCADIFVLPSRFQPKAIENAEKWGNTVNEAMSLGVPTILSTAVGSYADLILDGETGMLAQQDDSDSLAEKLNFLLEDDARRCRIGQNGAALLREKCTYEQNLGAYQAALAYAQGSRT